MKEIINRSALYVIPKKPFKDWAAYYNDDTQEELENWLNERRIYLIENIYDGLSNEVNEVLEQCYLKIFDYELMNWNGYKSEWPKERSLELFLAWFEVKLCDEILDLEPGRISTENAETI